MTAAEEVLRQLIDARLLTSYEVREEEHEPTRRVEIIHESLLANWPRLVRWQTQDQDGAQLRDELRQAARAWDDHDRQDDRLWTGTAFREYRLWRERYPGGLTDLEEAFAAAMISFATRRKRRRRIAAGVGTVVLLAVLAVVTGLWRHSVQQTRRAEASKLLTLGHLNIDDSPTMALACATKSLEISDTPEARRLAMRALWAGPPVFSVPYKGAACSQTFSPDGSHLAVGDWGGAVRLYPRDGGEPIELTELKGKGPAIPFFSPDSRHVVAGAADAGGAVVLWKTEGGPAIRTIKPIVGKSKYDWAFGSFEPDGSAVVTAAFEYDGASPLIPVSLRGRYLFQRWPIEGGEPQLLGTLSSTRVPMPGLDLERGLMVNGFRNELYLRRLKKLTSDPARVVARLPEVLALNSRIVFDPVADRLAICDSGGNLWLWPLDGDGSVPERKLHAPGSPWWTAFSHDGAHLAHASESGVRVWDLLGPVGSDPLLLTPSFAMGVAFTPDNRWLVAGHGGLGLPLWPVTQPYARTLHIHDGEIGHLQFSADGSRLFTLGRNDGKVLSIALTGGAGLEPETLLEMEPQYGWHLQADARGRFLIASGTGEIWMIPASGSAPSRIDQLEWFKSFSLDPAGRLAAGAVPDDTVTPTVIVFDLETGERREFDEPGDGQAGTPIFDAVGRMLVARGGVLSRWDPSTDSTEVLVDEGVGGYYPFGDGRRLFLGVDGVRVIHDLADGSQRRLAEAHQRGGAFAFDESGSIVATGRGSGEIRVGPLFDETPHLLLGHDGPVFQVEISPDGTWIVSTGQDGTVRFWPMPDFSKPPLHTLPHDELLARLKALTNIRVVPTEDSYTGYTFRPDPTAYHGWAEVPDVVIEGDFEFRISNFGFPPAHPSFLDSVEPG